MYKLLLNKRLIPGTIFALYLFTRLRLVKREHNEKLEFNHTA
ncbi:hypothetical protein VCRA2123E76_10416 [Vibrio crassostreae]|nr:hypothetical protein VCRA2123E76_10416 [Vibrio crassostreae]